MKFVFLSLFLSFLSCEKSTGSKSNTILDQQPSKSFSTKSVNVNDDISSSRQNAITKTVKSASPSIVGINVTEVREYRYYSPFLRDPLLEFFFGRSSPRYKEEVKSLGSGFIISKDGYVITNAHVVQNASKIVITLTDGSQHEAKIIGKDDLTDIGLLKIDGNDFPHVTFGDSDEIIVGEWAIALGNPFGLFDINNKPTVTVGIISAFGLNFPNVKGRSYRGMIQTDASINTGNSGGPLLNANGKVIGVNTFIYTGGGNGSIGIGFAIPINRVKGIISELKEHGKVDRAFKTGISIQPIDRGLSSYFGLNSQKGYIITGIESGSSGEKAGLKIGDIILEANDNPISSSSTLIETIRELRVGDYLKLKILRRKKILIVNVKLKKY